METTYDVKLILLGESGVGKTSLLLRFVSGIFKESLQRTRIDYSKKVIKIKDKEVNLTVWDTAGQEMYNSLMKSYYNLADGVLLVYDVQNAETFMTLSKWLVNLKSKNDKAEVLIAGNKIEDQSKKVVTISMVSNFARSEQLEHMGVSAKSGENVEILFHHLMKKILASRGILSYSKDHLLEKLEESREYLSPMTIITEQPQDIQEKVHTDNIETKPTGILKPMRNGPMIIKDLDTNRNTPETECKGASDIQELTEVSSFHDKSLCISDDETDSIGSADSALEFFDELEKDFTQNQSDTIKLHEMPPDTLEAEINKKKYCVI